MEHAVCDACVPDAPALIGAFVLDLDGTLLDEYYVDASIRAVCADVAARTGTSAEVLLAANEQIWPELWSEIGEKWMSGGISGGEVAREAWARTLRASGVGDLQQLEFVVDAHRGHEIAGYRLYEDVDGMLDAVSALKLAIITNGASDTQRAKLGALGLSSRVSATAISGEVGSVKPDPKIFEFALAALGVEAASAAMVGERLSNDIAGANAAGVTSVWLNRNGAVPSSGDAVPDRVIESLSQLPSVLASLASARI